jgi:membrane protease YdiL (CAAX protease family)
MSLETQVREKKVYAIIAVVVYVFEEVLSTTVHLMATRAPFLRHAAVVPLMNIVNFWILPFIVVYGFEKRDWRSLGLQVSPDLWLRYLAYGLLGIVLPACAVGFDRSLAIELLEQITYIGLAEEVFWRGYILNRLGEAFGSFTGLLSSAFLFGVAHVISYVARSGFVSAYDLGIVFVQPLLGGLLLGAIFLKARNIIPGAIFHIGMNAYLSRFLALFSV